MNVRKLNLTLWSLTAILLAAGALAVAWGFLTPVEIAADTEAVRSTTRPTTSQSSPDAQGSLESLAPLWAINFRKPLTDPATPPTPEVENPASTTVVGAGGPFVLVGTIGQSLAMIRTPAGLIEVHSIGETTSNGAKVVAIRPYQIDIEFNGERQTIVQPREGGGG